MAKKNVTYFVDDDNYEKKYSDKNDSIWKDYERMYVEENINTQSLMNSIDSTNSMINNASKSWRTEAQIGSVKDKINDTSVKTSMYKKYLENYGTDETSEFSKELGNVLDAYDKAYGDMNRLSQLYGSYRNEKDYNYDKQKWEQQAKDEKMAKRFAGLTYDQVEAEKKKRTPGSDEYNFLDQYGVKVGYSNLNDYDRDIANRPAEQASPIAKILVKGEDVVKNTIGKVIPMDTDNAMRRSVEAENNSYTSQLKRERNKRALDHASEAYSDVLNSPDIDKYRTTQETGYQKQSMLNTRVIDTFKNLGKDQDEIHEFINKNFAEGGSENGKQDLRSSAYFDKVASERYQKYSKMTSDEIAIYNKLFEEDKNKADQFLKDIDVSLSKRVYDSMNSNLSEQVKNTGAFGNAVQSIGAVGSNLMGNALAFSDDIGSALSGNEMNPYDARHWMMNQTTTTRATVGENIDRWTRENGMDTDIPFIGNLLPNMYQWINSAADSTVNAILLGEPVGLTAMGGGAFSQKAKEMKEAGYSDGEALTGAVFAGTFEALFEKLSLDNFIKAKHVDSWGRMAIEFFKQAGIEGSEEMFTEAANMIADYLQQGEFSDLGETYKEFIGRGYSEKEALAECAKLMGSRMMEAGIGGAFSGGLMGGPSAALNYRQNIETGRNVRENSQTSDLFNAVNEFSSNVENGEAKKYLDKIGYENADVASMKDAKLGALSTYAFEDAQGALDDAAKNKDEEMALKAYEQSYKLNDYTENKSDEERKRLAIQHSITQSEETINKNTGEAVNIQNVVKEDGETIVKTDAGDLKVSEISTDKNTAAAISFAANMTDSRSKMFMEFFNENPNVNAEALKDNFDLIYEASATNIGEEYVLNNSKVLTKDQALRVYQSVMESSAAERKANIDEIVKNHKGAAITKGTVDDSGLKGTAMTSDQYEQYKIANHVLADCLGANVVWYASKADADGKFRGKNGSFVRSKNTITLDINANKMTIFDKANILPVVSHEVTHWMMEKSPMHYQKLQKAVFDNLMKEYKYASPEDVIAAEMSKPGINDEETAKAEVVARACEDMLFNTDTFLNSISNLDAETRKTFLEKAVEFVQNIVDVLKEFVGQYKSKSVEAIAISNNIKSFEEVLAIYNKALEESIAYNKTGIFEAKTIDNLTNNQQAELADSNTESLVGRIAANQLEGAKDVNGGELFNYKAIEHDIPEYRRMLMKHGMKIDEINQLFETVDMALDKVKGNLAALDYAWDMDIDDRAFRPIKPNSDKLYKVSVDFSTLCRKRILQQAVQIQLQEALDRALTKEEGIAIRNELSQIQKEGKQIEIACALCYVESARMKSPVQIQKFLDDKRNVVAEYLATKNKDFVKSEILNAEMQMRQRLHDEYQTEIKNGMPDPMSYTLTKAGKKNYISLNKLPAAIKLEIQDAKREARANYKASAEEQQILDVVDSLTVSDFTTPDGLANLAKNHETIFDAYTSYVRNATHSKSLEGDTWWRAGDSSGVGDLMISNMNQENGMRTQSWSDFQTIHLLDYMAEIIELSTRGVKMQCYTKVPDYVRLMGLTNQMINLSLIPAAEYNGNLEYDSVEGMDFKTALELRDAYPDTAGTICIGINTEQTKKLLTSPDIDYVIPYHHSGMAKATRKVMQIPGWDSFESFQGEKAVSGAEAKANAEKYGAKLLNEKDAKWHKGPSFSEWVNVDKAKESAAELNRKASSGELTEYGMELSKKYGKMFGSYMAMQELANDYKRICAERGLLPKFSTTGGGIDGNFVNEENYWKLLIDRKMINNKTGEIIEQKAVEPKFNRDSVMDILDREVQKYQVVKADEEYASKKVVQKFLSGGMDDAIKNIAKTTGGIFKDTNNIAAANAIASGDDVIISGDINRDTQMSDVLNSVREIVDTNGKNYGRGVYLDSDVLSDLKENERKSALLDYFRGFEGNDFDAYNYKGEPISIRIEKRSKKFNNGKKRVSVNNDLLSKNINNRVKQETLLLVDEAISTSKLLNKKDSNYSHGWVDNNGKNKWETWRTYVVDSDRNIYEVILDIATTSEGYKVLYDLEPKIKNVGRSVYSVQSPRNETISQERKGSQEENDILGSTREEQRYASIEELEAENAQLKAIIENIAQGSKEESYIKLKDNSKLISEVNKLLKANKSKIGLQTAVNGILEVYNAVNNANNDTSSADEMFAKAKEIAQKILESAESRKIINNDALLLKKNIKSLRFSLTPEQIEEAKTIMGKETFTKAKRIFHNYDATATNIDGQWAEWSNQLGEDVLPFDTNEKDMFKTLVDAYAAADKASMTIEAVNTAENVKELSYDILDMWDRIDAIAKESDIRKMKQKQTADVDSLKKKHREEMAKLREKHNATVDSMRENFAKQLVRETKLREQIKNDSKERADALRENARKRAEIDTITKRSKVLRDKLVQNSKDKHINSAIADPIARLLDAIDFSSKQMLRTGEMTMKDEQMLDVFKAVEEMAQKARDNAIGYSVDEDFSAIDLAPEFLDYVKKIRTTLDGIADAHGSKSFILNQMSVEELKDLNTMLSMLQSYATNVDKMLASTNNASITTLAQSFMEDAKKYGVRKRSNILNGFSDKAKDFVDYDNATPYYFFKRLGEPGKQIFSELMDGQDKLAFNMHNIDMFAEGLTDKRKNWSTETKEFELLTVDFEGNKKRVPIKMSVAQMMSIYATYKRGEQGTNHLFGGGIKLTDYKDSNGKTIHNDVEGVVLNKNDAQKIFDELTDEQKNVTEEIVKYFATVCADWGNEVTMKRFGIRSFGENNYFPLRSDSDVIGADTPAEKQTSLLRLLNMSFTKNVNPNANNRIVIDGVFDVLKTHASDMALYNAFSLPVLDTFKFLNYKESIPGVNGENAKATVTVRGTMDLTYGKKCAKYINNLLEDINGSQSSGRKSELVSTIMSNYKTAAVGGSFFVGALQPTSYFRASAVLDPEYLAKGLTAHPLKEYEEACEKCGIALWKSYGVYDTDISRKLEKSILDKESFKDKMVEASMTVAEYGDKITWGAMWNACKSYVDKEMPNIRKGSDEYFHEASMKFREVVYSSQVVDSVLTRTDLMRSKEGIVKQATSFMSEPAISLNLINDIIYSINMDYRETGSKVEAIRRNRKRLARAFTAYAVTNVVTAMIEALRDFSRDDKDEDEDKLKSFIDAFVDNFLADMDLIGKLPFIKDYVPQIAVTIYNLATGSKKQVYEATRMDTAVATTITSALTKIYKYFTEEGNKRPTGYATLYAIMKALSQLSGLPFSNILRDGRSAWNATFGTLYPSLQLRLTRPKTKKEDKSKQTKTNK